MRARNLALPSRRVSSKFRARVCISPAPQSPSPKLDTTCSLRKQELLTSNFFVFILAAFASYFMLVWKGRESCWFDLRRDFFVIFFPSQIRFEASKTRATKILFLTEGTCPVHSIVLVVFVFTRVFGHSESSKFLR